MLVLASLLLMALLWYSSIVLRFDWPQARGWLDARDRMNPYGMVYLHEPDYSYQPLSDPLFLTSAVLADAAVFGIPAFLLGLLGGPKLVRAAGALLVGAPAP